MRRGLLAVAVVAATFVAYMPAIKAPLTFDDDPAIRRNKSIQSLKPTIALRPPPTTPMSGRPVANYSLAVNYAVNKWLGIDQAGEPASPYKTVNYHIANILLHLACAALLFGVLARTLALPRFASWLTAKAVTADGIAGAITLLWTLHPIQTEAVNYLTQRTELLVSLFYLATLYASIRAHDATGPRRMLWWATAVASCALGMASKEVMVSAPIMVVLYDRAFRFPAWRTLATRVRPYAALAATWIVLIALMVTDPREDAVGFGLGIPWYSYLYTQAWAIARYLQLVLWPSLLTIDYGTRPITGLAGVPGLLLLGTAFVASVRAWMRPAQWGWLAFLGAWFFLLLAPSSSVVPIVTEIAAERRIYLALAAVMTLFVVGFVSGAPNKPWRAYALIAVTALAAATTFIRSRTYSSVEELWRDAAAKVPTNARAWEIVGVEIWSRERRREEAGVLFRRAIATDSTYAPGYLYAGTVALEEGRIAEAIGLLKRALAVDPDYTEAQATLGSVLLTVGDPAGAIPLLEAAAPAAGNTQSMVNLGAAYMMTGRADDAIRVYLAALDREPGRPDVLSALGGLLLGKGEFITATSFLERAIARSGGAPFDHAILAVAYAESGRADEATRAASRAVRLAPTDARVLVFAGRAMARAGRRVDAEQYLRSALRVDPANREALAALAALGKG